MEVGVGEEMEAVGKMVEQPTVTKREHLLNRKGTLLWVPPWLSGPRTDWFCGH